MATNYVEIKIKASDTAKPDLTALRAQLDELGSKVESAKVDVNDVDAKAKLLALNAKLAALNKQAANPKITVAGAARVEAQIAAIAAQLKHLGDQSATADVKVNTLRSRLLALGKTAGTVTGLSDTFGVFNSKASMASRIMSGFSLATGLLEAPLSGAIVGIGGLASGVAAAGLGLAAFGAVAKSNYAAASTAANQTQAAQTAYNASITKANFVYKQQLAAATNAKQAQAATSAHAKALMAAEASQVKATAVAYDQLSPPQIALAKAIGNAKNSWQSFVQSNTSGVASIMTQGIGLLPKIFQMMQPFIDSTTAGLDVLMGKLKANIGSGWLKGFMSDMATFSGPAIVGLGTAIGNIVKGIMGIVRAFIPMGVTVLGGLDKITAKFATWGQTLTQHSGFQSLVSMAQADMPLVIQIVKNLGVALVNLGKSMTGLSTFSNSKMLLQMLVPLTGLLKTLTQANPALLRFGLYALAAGGAVQKLRPALEGIRGGIDAIKGGVGAFQKVSAGFRDSAAAASEATGVWGSLGGKLSSAISAVREWGVGAKIAAAATRVWTAVQAAFDVVMAMNPLTLIIIAIAALVAAIVILTLKFSGFRAFWKAAWHDIASVFDTVRHGIAAGFGYITSAASAAFSWVKSHWPLLLGILTGPIGLATAYVVTHWRQIVSGAQNMIGSLIGFFRSLPGRILSALGNLGSLLFNAGANVIKGLINGISSMIGGVTHAIGSVVSEITSHLPFSPAKKGPLSGRGSPDKAGQRIAQMLGQGMTSGLPSVTAAAARLAGGASVGGGVGGGGGANAPMRLQLEWVGGGGDPLLQWIRNQIRIKGGNVQAVLGH